MNPIRLLRIYVKANRLLSLFQSATDSYERTHSMSKSIWVSKMFWFNLLTAAAELTQVLPLPAGTLAIATSLINIGLRIVTDQPVHLVTPKT